MTLLAAVMKDDVPFLITDVLCTATGEDVKHQPLATFKDVSSQLTPENWRSVCDPVQKAYIISDNFCVGVAGNKYGCHTAIKDLYERYRDQPVSLENILSFLVSGEIDTSKRNDVTLIGWIADQAGVKAFEWCSVKPDDYLVGNQFISGSGREIFLQNISCDQYQYFETRTKNSNKSIMWALGEAGQMLFAQVGAGHYLLNEFGGGFQIIYFDGSKFNFLDNYIFLFCSGKILEENKYEFNIGGPMIVQRYIEDKFTIVRFDIPADAPFGNRISLRKTEKTINIAENFISDDENPNEKKILSNIQTKQYLIPICWEWPSGRQSLQSNVIRSGDNGPIHAYVNDDEGRNYIEIGDSLNNIIGECSVRERISSKHDIIQGKKFRKEFINLDGIIFKDCEFIECDLVYSGGVLPKLDDNSFFNCKWHLEGAADRTIALMRGFYQAGGNFRSLVENSLKIDRNRSV